MDFKTFERSNRDKTYKDNLIKENKITEVFINYCRKAQYLCKVNPTDSEANLKGCDVEITDTFTNLRLNIDLKGCQSKYNNVCLSYARSYDGTSWFNTLENKITSAYVFIDELDQIYFISKSKILENLENYKHVTVNPKTAGHWQQAVLIPKKDLKLLQWDVKKP